MSTSYEKLIYIFTIWRAQNFIKNHDSIFLFIKGFNFITYFFFLILEVEYVQDVIWWLYRYSVQVVFVKEFST